MPDGRKYEIGNYRSLSVIRRTVFTCVFWWQVNAKIGVRLIAEYLRATKYVKITILAELTAKQDRKRTLNVNH